MGNIGNILNTIFIGIFIAYYLGNTGRALKSMELYEKCLFLALKIEEKEEQLVKLLIAFLYKTMFDAYCLIHDYKNAAKYSRKLRVLYRD